MLLVGVLVVVLAGLCVGTCVWPLKVIRKYSVEHWLFIWVLFGIVVLPWASTLIFCPNLGRALATMDHRAVLLSNLFAVGWGCAAVLSALCMVRIGFVLTNALFGGLAISIGVIVPMVFKASGLFESAPDLNTTAGRWLIVGVAVIISGVVASAFAGFGRDRLLGQTQKRSGSFLQGLIMVLVGGILSIGPAFAFAYGQGPIVDAMKKQGAAELPATISVWAIGMFGGAVVNLIYAAFQMTRNRSWNRLGCVRDMALAGMTGLQFFVFLAMFGIGMKALGVLGASVGTGLYQVTQTIGGQSIGFLSGEWRGVFGTPRRLIFAAILLFVVATVILAYGNSFA